MRVLIRANVATFAAIGVLICFAQYTFAQDNTPPARLEWWQVATGVLAIPTSIVGIAYSIVLANKSRYEVEKTKLEIIEKQLSIRKLQESGSGQLSDLTKSLFEAKQLQHVLLRFVIFSLIMIVWSSVETFYGKILGLSFLGVSNLLGVDVNRTFDLPESNPFLYWVFIFLKWIPRLVYYTIILVMGLPLFRDASKLVGLDPREFFTKLRR